MSTFESQVVGLLPECIGRVEVLEILHEPRAVERLRFRCREGGEPASPEKLAVLAHRIEFEYPD